MKFIERLRPFLDKFNSATLNMRVLVWGSALATAYILLCFFRSPQISDAIIAVGLLGISSWAMWLKAKEIQPTFENEKVKELRGQADELRLQKEIVALQLDYARIKSTIKLTNEEKPTGQDMFGWNLKK